MFACLLSFLLGFAAAAHAGIEATHPPRYYACKILVQSDLHPRYFIYPNRDSDGALKQSFRPGQPIFMSYIRSQRAGATAIHWWAEGYPEKTHEMSATRNFETWIYDERQGLLASALTTRGAAATVEEMRSSGKINTERLQRQEPDRFGKTRELEERLGGDAGLALIEEKVASQDGPAEDALTFWSSFHRCESINRIVWYIRAFLESVAGILKIMG